MPEAHVNIPEDPSMWSHSIQPTFDPSCRRVFHADRQGAQAHLVALEVWNRATGRDLGGRRLVVYRCSRCAGYHVAARFAKGASPPASSIARDHRRAGTEVSA